MELGAFLFSATALIKASLLRKRLLTWILKPDTVTMMSGGLAWWMLIDLFACVAAIPQNLSVTSKNVCVGICIWGLWDVTSIACLGGASQRSCWWRWRGFLAETATTLSHFLGSCEKKKRDTWVQTSFDKFSASSPILNPGNYKKNCRVHPCPSMDIPNKNSATTLL